MQGAGELLNTKIEYLTTVSYMSRKFFVAVGSDKLLFISDKFDKVEANIDYGWIRTIILSTLNPYLFQM